MTEKVRLTGCFSLPVASFVFARTDIVNTLSAGASWESFQMMLNRNLS